MTRDLLVMSPFQLLKNCQGSKDKKRLQQMLMQKLAVSGASLQQVCWGGVGTFALPGKNFALQNFFQYMEFSITFLKKPNVFTKEFLFSQKVCFYHCHCQVQQPIKYCNNLFHSLRVFAFSFLTISLKHLQVKWCPSSLFHKPAKSNRWDVCPSFWISTNF